MVTPNVSKNASNSSGGYVVDRSYTNRIYTPSELISPALKRRIKKGDVLSLRKEPSNKYDRKAVAVYWKHKKIGYLYQNGLRDIVMEYWKREYPFEITFDSFSSDKSDESATADFKFFKPTDGRSTQSLSPDEMQLLADYRGLTPPGKEYIRQTMAMAKNSYGEKNDSVSDLEAAD